MKIFRFSGPSTFLSSVCSPDSGAFVFFASILVWGTGIGAFSAVMNNFVVEEYGINGFQRGVMEFLRETPGVLLVFLLAALHRFSDWKVLRIGTIVSLVAAGLMLIHVPWVAVMFFIMLWALGEHLVMPVRQSIAMSLARPGKGGESLGIMTSAMNAGTVAGSLLVALIFHAGTRYCGVPEQSQRVLYNGVWVLIMVLLALSVAVTLGSKEPANHIQHRPSLYFHKKYKTFYILELFYGARKQVFFTFAPFVLVTDYGMSTRDIAILFGVSAFLTAMYGGRLIGKIVDKVGYRNVMIWDTVILFFVCLLYGFAKDLFPMQTAQVVVCVTYILDAIISNCSIATNLYAKTLSSSQEELTATLSSGISFNHLVTVFYALLGGWILTHYGAGAIFSIAAIMALANSAFALTIPRPQK